MCRTLFILSLLFLSLSVSAKKFSKTVDPFTSISLCVPFTVQVSVSDSSEPYVIKVDADEDVYSALKTDVSDGELTVSASGDFETGNPIKVTIKLPVDKLEGITVQGGSQHVYVSGKFESDSLDIVSGGAKSIYAPLLTVKKELSVQNSGVGDVVLGSAIEGDVTANLAGISKVYLIGVSGKVQARLDGISKLGVAAKGDDMTIEGSVNGLGTIFYTGGTCSATGGRFFATPCEKVASLDIVDESTTFKWTCGTQFKGESVCGTDTSGTTTFSDGVRSMSFASAVSTGGSSSISTSTTGPGGSSVTISGDNAAASATSSSECDVPEEELFILDEA